MSVKVVHCAVLLLTIVEYTVESANAWASYIAGLSLDKIVASGVHNLKTNFCSMNIKFSVDILRFGLLQRAIDEIPV